MIICCLNYLCRHNISYSNVHTVLKVSIENQSLLSFLLSFCIYFLFFHQQQNKEKEMKSRCLDSACGLCYLSMHIDRQWLSFFNRSIENNWKLFQGCAVSRMCEQYTRIFIFFPSHGWKNLGVLAVYCLHKVSLV